jgi:hypothetical protein
MAVDVLRKVNQIMPSENWCDHYGVFYEAVMAAVKDYMKREERQRKRIAGARAVQPQTASAPQPPIREGSD